VTAQYADGADLCSGFDEEANQPTPPAPRVNSMEAVLAARVAAASDPLFCPLLPADDEETY